ncbi:unnamed protein product [Caenorhabditis bovis]|uniref:Regulatory protein zeste n=1 Tax=Caenorhabditis bovis TaxID=2654633 RepID=A0A8S1EXN5_9PELO|nr:unnamed protein product [Caenorhabditis bovis]
MRMQQTTIDEHSTHNGQPASLSAAVGQRRQLVGELSNFIVDLVLERREDLIKNSNRRLTTENLARNEHWQKIAEIVNERFEIAADIERVKSHFHNRKKVLLARIKDEFKTIPNINEMTIDEKIKELVNRRICIDKHDEKFAKVCLEFEEEEKTATESEQCAALNQVFGEQVHPSLLSQLLSTTTCDETPSIASTTDYESSQLLAKMLSGPSSNSNCCNGTMQQFRNNPSPSSKDAKPYLSHLIVDVTSPNELKRLLSLLIDHRFTRFQHIESQQNADLQTAMPKLAEALRRNERRTSQPVSHTRASPFSENVPENHDEQLLDAIQNRIERVDVELKTAPDSDDGDCIENDSNFGDDYESLEREGSPLNKRMRVSSEPMVVTCEVVLSLLNNIALIRTAQMCGADIRLNTGGSKWNLYAHAVHKHSEFKAFRCTLCPYESGRKIRVREHATSIHNQKIEPLDLTTPEIRKEWLNTMSMCFPQHRYNKNTINMKIQ